MDIGGLMDLISNVGFPIAVCGYLLYQQGATQKMHNEESAGFVDAINNNTRVIDKLTTKLDEMENKIDG